MLWIYLFILHIIILFWNCEIKGVSKFNKDFNSQYVTKCLRGFCALGIFIHQIIIGEFRANFGIFEIYRYLGYTFVSFFLFFSGYGLMKSLLTKNDYLKTFFKKRVLSIFIPYYIINLISTIILLTTDDFYFTGYLRKNKRTKTDIVLTFLGIYYANGQCWFIIELFVLYILFYFSHKIFSGNKALFMNIILIFLLVLIGRFLPIHKKAEFWFSVPHYYESIMAFPYGMIISNYESAIVKFVQNEKIYYLILIFFGILGVTLTGKEVKIEKNHRLKGQFEFINYFTSYKTFFFRFFLQSSAVITIISFVFLLTMKIKIGNQLLEYYGDLSFEFYLVEKLSYKPINYKHIIVKDYYEYYCIYALILSTKYASLFQMLTHKIFNLIQNKKTNEIQKLPVNEETSTNKI